MNEIERVVKYIRSCRDAGIDTTITIDINRSHLVLNALEKALPVKPRFDHMLNDTKYKAKCPICGEWHTGDVTQPGYTFCHKCGQKLDWNTDDEN